MQVKCTKDQVFGSFGATSWATCGVKYVAIFMESSSELGHLNPRAVLRQILH